MPVSVGKMKRLKVEKLMCVDELFASIAWRQKEIPIRIHRDAVITDLGWSITISLDYERTLLRQKQQTSSSFFLYRSSFIHERKKQTKNSNSNRVRIRVRIRVRVLIRIRHQTERIFKCSLFCKYHDTFQTSSENIELGELTLQIVETYSNKLGIFLTLLW